MANSRRQAGNQSVNQGIANSWSFIAFVKAHGKKVQIADFVTLTQVKSSQLLFLLMMMVTDHL